MIAWLALACSLVALLPWLLLGAFLPRWWRKMEPQLRPLLQMFTPSPPPARCEYRGVEGDRCELAAGHTGVHEWPTLNGKLA